MTTMDKCLPCCDVLLHSDYIMYYYYWKTNNYFIILQHTSYIYRIQRTCDGRNKLNELNWKCYNGSWATIFRSNRNKSSTHWVQPNGYITPTRDYIYIQVSLLLSASLTALSLAGLFRYRILLTKHIVSKFFKCCQTINYNLHLHKQEYFWKIMAAIDTNDNLQCIQILFCLKRYWWS